MSRRSLDADIIRNKLDAIERSLQTLVSIGNIDTERLDHDPIIAAAVERLICRVVDLAVETNTHISASVLARSPGDYRESFDFAHRAGALDSELLKKIKPSVGMRNAIVHEYVKVDYSIVATAVPLAIEVYTDYRRQVAAFTLAHIEDASSPDGAAP
ncbi:type VII toxin-antitoxin system HepT family RNase toxin [Phytoactinopolyspora mesophila]|uniref:DUF86 domain-containing protein n=1 Tax=Phytoactinopolyspora mesophila TaxID=2650750 RepID=A0A7K3M1L6_9ACTN|nr:HepT-like ribonuclease domain-containing protein [Phytoactinopolyspora mesophila]NDL57169.1 DUF86 domain-containing protein [Phytoactinopolyspora mesophila]